MDVLLSGPGDVHVLLRQEKMTNTAAYMNMNHTNANTGSTTTTNNITTTNSVSITRRGDAVAEDDVVMTAFN